MPDQAATSPHIASIVGRRGVLRVPQVPEIDGLQLCRMIRERGGDYVYFILISSLKVTRERQTEAEKTRAHGA